MQTSVQRLKVADSAALVWGCAVLFYLASLFVSGYDVYCSNQAFQIPLVLRTNDGSLYPGDPLVETLPQYASLLWRAVAYGARVVPLEPLLLVLFLIERALVLFAAGCLAHVLTRGSRLAVVSAMAVFALLPQPVLGHGTLVVGYFEQTGFAIAFFLLAMAAFYARRPVLWAIALSVGFSLNSMYGAYAITYFAAALLLDPTYRAAWRVWGPATALFMLLASPAIALTLSAFSTHPADKRLWLAASRVRLPHHLYPMTWSKGSFAWWGILLTALLGLLHQNRRRMRTLAVHGVIWSGVSVCWVLYSFIAAYVAEEPSMLVMHPARATDLWCCLAAVALVSLFATAVEEEDGGRARAAVGMLASVVLWAPVPSSVTNLPKAGLLALAMLSWRPVWDSGLRRGDPTRLALAIATLVVLAGGWRAGALSQAGPRYGFMMGPEASMVAVAEWARAATSKDAAFLVDPRWEQFRAVSQRAVFTTWKDGAAILWDKRFAPEWATRLHALGLDISRPSAAVGSLSELGELYSALSDDRVTALAERFGIDYWVARRDHPSSLPVVFSTRQFKVLAIRQVAFAGQVTRVPTPKDGPPRGAEPGEAPGTMSLQAVD